MATRVFDGIKFCEQFYKEDLPRNIPAKFGPNWPSGLGGVDVLRIVVDARRTPSDPKSSP